MYPLTSLRHNPLWCVVLHEQFTTISCVEPDSSLVEQVPRNPKVWHIPLIPLNHGGPYFLIQKIRIIHRWCYFPIRSLEQLLVINFYATFWSRDIRMGTCISCACRCISFCTTSQLPQDLNLHVCPAQSFG